MERDIMVRPQRDELRPICFTSAPVPLPDVDLVAVVYLSDGTEDEADFEADLYSDRDDVVEGWEL